MRERRSGGLFEGSLGLHRDVVSRRSVGDWIMGEEAREGTQAEGLPEESHAAVGYRVNEGEITFVRMFM